MRKLFAPALLVIAAALILSALSCSQKKTPGGLVPSPQYVVDKMLDVAKVTPNDVVYDLGCGDGIIVVSAAKRGARAVGFEIVPERVRETQDNIDKNNVGDRAKVVEQDIFTVDLDDADVITLYLLPRVLEGLIPQLEKLKPGTRIVSHNFPIRGIKAQEMISMETPTGEHRIYLWHTPLEREEPTY